MSSYKSAAMAPPDEISVTHAWAQLGFDQTTGGLVRINVDGVDVMVAAMPAELAIVVGGTPSYNRHPEPTSSDSGASRPPLGPYTSVVPQAQTARGDAMLLGGVGATFLGIDEVDVGDAVAVSTEHAMSGWRWKIEYTVHHADHVLGIDVRVRRDAADEPTPLDYVRWRTQGWQFTPGPLDSLSTELGNGLHRSLRDGGSAIFFRLAEGEWGRWEIDDGGRVDAGLSIGSAAATSRWVHGGGFRIAFSPRPGARAADVVQRHLVEERVLGLHRMPQWAERAHIYETFIGHWPQLAGGPSYAPYPTTAALRADLARIRDLGFDVLYLMPRHPYPSYTTASFTDHAAQYGDGPGTLDQFRMVVQEAHEHGIKVIIDVVLHGVLDQEALDVQLARRAAGSSRRGGAWETYELAHENAWRAEAPQQHPMWVDHPDWFSQLPDGSSQYTYTKSLDLRHPGFRAHLASSLAASLIDPGLDGFRFDAPWWNHATYRWNEDSEYRASWSIGAGASLLREIHRHCAEVRDDALIFVESADALTTSSAHLQYPYDETGTLIALMDGTITGREGAERLGYLRRLRPPGVRTVHWVDAHDSAWWPPVGRKWRREMFGPGPARAALLLCALLDGAFMAFSGAEESTVELHRQLLSLRRSHHVLTYGLADELAIEADSPALVPILRSIGSRWVACAVNFSAEPITTTLSLPTRLGRPTTTLKDVLRCEPDGDPASMPCAAEEGRITLELDPYSAAALEPLEQGEQKK